VELTVLGASGTWPSAGAANSGYLVQHGGFNLWVDTGNGTLANLQRHIEIREIDGILISHAHPDHFVDLYPCFYARHYGGLGEPGLPVIVPTDFTRVLTELVSPQGRVVIQEAFALREVAPGEGFEIGPFCVKTEPMSHLGLPALGFRLETGGVVLAYTGDTGPTKSVERLARGSDLLLSEATWQDHDDLKPFHLSSRQAAIHARNAEVGKLVLTHVWPTNDKKVSVAQAAEEYAGPIEAAVEDARFEVSG
jgi:ribonuclease BN (tRNA processing enzyme)